MVKVKEKPREFRAKPVLQGISDLEIVVNLLRSENSILLECKTLYANLTYSDRNDKDIWIQGIPLQMRALHTELTKKYYIIIEANLGYYNEGINKSGLTKTKGLSVRLIEPYRRRLREALYKTLRAVVEEI